MRLHPPFALPLCHSSRAFALFAAPSFASSPASPPATGFTSSVIPSAARNLLTTAWPRLHHAAQVKHPFLLLPSIHFLSPPSDEGGSAPRAHRRERPSPKLYLSPHQETYGQFSATYGPRPLPRPAGIIKVIQCGRAHALMVAGTFPPPLAAAIPQHPPTHVRLTGTLSPNRSRTTTRPVSGGPLPITPANPHAVQGDAVPKPLKNNHPPRLWRAATHNTHQPTRGSRALCPQTAKARPPTPPLAAATP